jgi:hypothetical protein
VVIYANNQTAQLLSPEPLVVEPQSARVNEPTFLCNQVMAGSVDGGSKIRSFGLVVGYPKGIQIVTCGSVLCNWLLSSNWLVTAEAFGVINPQ